MPIDWNTAYQVALRETNPAKLPDLCDTARKKINERILELGTHGAHAQEREDLEDALHKLVIHELKQTGRSHVAPS